MWKVGSEEQLLPPLPPDPRDPRENSETSIFNNPSVDFGHFACGASPEKPWVSSGTPWESFGRVWGSSGTGPRGAGPGCVCFYAFPKSTCSKWARLRPRGNKYEVVLAPILNMLISLIPHASYAGAGWNLLKTYKFPPVPGWNLLKTHKLPLNMGWNLLKTHKFPPHLG